MKVVYSARYHIDIGPHVFPTLKYRLVYDAIRGREPLFQNDSRPVFVEPEQASWDELALVHTAEYLSKMRDGSLTDEDAAQLELPWSQEMVDGFRLMAGGTIDAACLACGRGREPFAVSAYEPAGVQKLQKAPDPLSRSTDPPRSPAPAGAIETVPARSASRAAARHARA